MHANIPLSTFMYIYTKPYREYFLEKKGLDRLQECGKKNSRDYSHGEGKTGNFSRMKGEKKKILHLLKP